jgi:hypothetical protein
MTSDDVPVETIAERTTYFFLAGLLRRSAIPLWEISQSAIRDWWAHWPPAASIIGAATRTYAPL